MKYLAIDTSGSHLTVVLKLDDKQYIEYSEDCNLKHSVLLMDCIEKVLSRASASIFELDFLACVVGAGSFTGIRIGISTIKALAMCSNKKVLGVTSFDVLAYTSNNQDDFLAVKANSSSFYLTDKKGLASLDIKVVTKDELLKVVNTREVVSSSEIAKAKTIIADLPNGLIHAVECMADNAQYDRETLLPLYVKKSQAEEMLCK